MVSLKYIKFCKNVLCEYNTNPVIITIASFIVSLLTNQSSAPIPVEGTHSVYKHMHLYILAVT